MNIFLLITLLTVEHLSFSPLDVELRGDGYSYLKNGVLTLNVGEPAIPGYVVHLIIRGDGDISVNYKNPVVLGEFYIPPLQPPTILSQKDIKLIKPDVNVYRANNEYPGKGFERLKGGNTRNKRVESILIYPLQYRPVDRVLTLYQDVIIEGDVSLLDDKLVSVEDFKNDYAGYEYLIITNDYLAPYFEPLREWKTRKGVPTKVVTTQEIYSTSQGRDNQEKIREFIKSQNEDSGVVWVLLGGDADVVPSRLAFAFECGAGMQFDEDSIPCDLYYSDIDGDWDLDGDGIFGEVEDSIDMLADVFVGRAPVNSIPEVQNFVAKLLMYEKSPPTDYLTKALFFAMVLWDDPITDGAVHKDMIDSQFIPSNFIVTKLYERDGTGSAEGVIDTINEGKHIMNHDGHGWIDIISMHPGWIRNWDMDGLINGDKLGILYSIGCWTGAFDYDCIGEHFMNATDGGGIAYLGNSRYGWGSPGNPGYGYSDIFDNKFFQALFVDSIINIGIALAQSKAYYAGLAGYGNVYRWCEYQINLFGDPEMPIWTDTPEEVIAVFPDTIPAGEFSLFIQVLSTEGLPIEGVMITYEGDDYKRGLTNSCGEVELGLSTSTVGYAYITVSGTNILPFEDSIYVFNDGAYLSLEAHYTNTELNPGDTVNLICLIRNYGSSASEASEVILTTDDMLTFIINGLDTLTQLTPSGVDTVIFTFSVSESAQNGHLIRFSLSEIGQFNEIVKKPILELTGVHKDGPVDAGDSGMVFLGIKNIGFGTAWEITVNVFSLDSFVQFDRSETYIDSVLPDSSVTLGFDFTVSPDCPSPYLSQCMVDYGIIDTFTISIGCYGLFDDFERHTVWYTTGDWHIDEYRSFSPSHSFYCGDSLTRQYSTLVCDSLLSPPFYIDDNSELSFWHWFDMAGLEDLACPGCDGLYIGVIDSSEFYLLDFIGSGGALDSVYNSFPYWYKSVYDLSFIPAGTEIRILFRFISNGSRCGEGWYIDDVLVQPTYLGVEEEELQFLLFQNYPNPFSKKTVISYQLSVIGEDYLHPTPYALRIYDLSGRLVRTFNLCNPRKSVLSVLWDGRNDRGKLVPGGVYFYRLEASGSSITKKLILLR